MSYDVGCGRGRYHTSHSLHLAALIVELGVHLNGVVSRIAFAVKIDPMAFLDFQAPI